MELLGEDELVQHQMMHLSEEIDITKAKLLDIGMKIFLSTLSNDKEDEYIHQSKGPSYCWDAEGYLKEKETHTWEDDWETCIWRLPQS